MPGGTNGINDTTAVGSYAYPSYYGTYDQGGDAGNWNESIYDGSSRGVRGGAFGGPASLLQSGSFYSEGGPANAYCDVGFRVSQLTPEPGSLGLFAFGVTGMLLRRRRARRQPLGREGSL